MTVPCGHSFCMTCIKSHWDKEDVKRVYSCPQCWQTFTERPVLVKSTMMADLVEELKKTAGADHCYAGPEDVACDVCTGRKRKACKSCMQCLVSFCEADIKPHYDSPAFKEHTLVEPSRSLQESVCSVHDEVIEMFCCTDQQSICYLCSVSEHKDHETVPIAERTEGQRELEVTRLNIQQRIQDTEREVKLLQQEVEAINGSADKAVEHIGKKFTELICLLKKRSSDAKRQVENQQKPEEQRASELQKKLDQEITDLYGKNKELKRLSDTKDHTTFLVNYPTSVSGLKEEDKDSSSFRIGPLRYLKGMHAAVLTMGDKLQGVLREEWTNLSRTVTEVDVLLTQPKIEPETRAEFLQYWCDITLDPNTAHQKLLLSDGDRKVTATKEKQFDLSHPDRFTDEMQVLSREGLTGRCYFEVECKSRDICVAVSYKNINRDTEKHCENTIKFGYNENSWALDCVQEQYRSFHEWRGTAFIRPPSPRVGVYLDHGAGILSFYSVSETMTLLHRVMATFSQPLHAGLRLYRAAGDTAEFCKLK
ncbi:tripartite motif-containing protein 16-like [Notolabrus celidotus]|uniref:tripartite motif-containing protein 16-like n=1 Tax=Notolabrus celidotus TaxID=1203425 RepID=UPI0014902823|nr:tripartite motif-containing protein 16-like [Notolabrus celidotus]